MHSELILYDMRLIDDLAARLAGHLSAEIGNLEHRHFPDGESYIRLNDNLENKTALFVADLINPDCKLMPLFLAASTARRLGAKSVGLIAPYLPYMRQDKAFKTGEAKSAEYFAALISREFDLLITIDPHLHRHNSLNEIYTLDAVTLSASPLLEKWISKNIEQPLLIGPDIESEQWVSAVAQRLNAPYRIGRKTRMGDHEVRLTLPDLNGVSERTPIILDDIISTGQTLIKTIETLKEKGLTPPICLAVHGLFTSKSRQSIIEAGAQKIVTTTTVSGSASEINIAGLVASAITKVCA